MDNESLDLTDAPAIMVTVKDLWKEVEELVAEIRQSRGLDSDGGRKITAQEWPEVAAEVLDVAQAANKVAAAIVRGIAT
jgi:hypothetical protein